MTIRCIAIDDEPLALDIIKTYLGQIPNTELIASFSNPIEASEIIKTNNIDLMFLDVEMPLLSGIDFLKTIKNPPKVILTTAYRHYAIESYELDVIDYLLKPISFRRFFKAISKYKSVLKEPSVPVIEIKEQKILNDHMYVNANKKFVKINFEDILYVESLKDYVRIHLLDKSITTKDSISNFENKLPKTFLRIHRSFIVNVTKVTAFTKVDVEIGTKEIPIGASYKEQVIGFFKD
ncbi:LytTR family DNA-binding domain-containing protein [uncultured Aquimarina sp.]|uniref:LytR/AlgR family response regulator transcription factor n=1 Tax=uncultured Aquimarina sp. TaxID=575652 RepID=UPI002602B3F8|nr:response regulator transcription factor [uncultured Aquimarina sp.]